VRIDDSQPWRQRLLRTLEVNYRRSPNYDKAMQVLTGLIENQTNVLAEFNIHAITRISEVLGLSCEFVRQSELAVDGAATTLLINISKAVGADTYLAGGGATGYQEDELFPKSNLTLAYQNFMPRPYGDPKTFLPGLSIIDYLLNATEWRMAGSQCSRAEI
jgi:hypothetical protein